MITENSEMGPYLEWCSTTNPWEVKAGGPKVQGHPRLQSECQAIIGYLIVERCFEN